VAPSLLVQVASSHEGGLRGTRPSPLGDKKRSSLRSRVVRPGSGAVMLSALASCALVPVLWSGPALAAPAKHPVGYFNLHPCALFTKGQAGGAIRARVTHTIAEPNAKFGGACFYGTSGKQNVDVSFAPGPLSSLLFAFPGKPQKESSVAPGAICIVVSASAQKRSGAPDPANLLVSMPGSFVIDVSTAKCAEGVPLAKIAVAEVS
jgi:hypothetical protein